MIEAEGQIEIAVEITWASFGARRGCSGGDRTASFGRSEARPAAEVEIWLDPEMMDDRYEVKWHEIAPGCMKFFPPFSFRRLLSLMQAKKATKSEYIDSAQVSFAIPPLSLNCTSGINKQLQT